MIKYILILVSVFGCAKLQHQETPKETEPIIEADLPNNAQSGPSNPFIDIGVGKEMTLFLPTEWPLTNNRYIYKTVYEYTLTDVKANTLIEVDVQVTVSNETKIVIMAGSYIEVDSLQNGAISTFNIDPQMHHGVLRSSTKYVTTSDKKSHTIRFICYAATSNAASSGLVVHLNSGRMYIKTSEIK